MRSNFTDGPTFEREVRNIARQLWNSAPYSGPVTIDGKERDGVFVTEENIHIVEATISRKAEKADSDLLKISNLILKFRKSHPDKAVKGWFITNHEPTGEQGAKIIQYHGRVIHQTYLSFFGRLIDSRTYLKLRENYPFGSARDIATDKFDLKPDGYVPVELSEPISGLKLSNGAFVKRFSKDPMKAILLGEFGVGKSMFLRDLFFRLKLSHEVSADDAFPVYINLRDHIEQYDPAECLTRHPKSIGMADPTHLVRAWRAGYTYLILDGFDELTPRIITRDQKRVRDIRRSALELVRRLMDETPSRSSVILAGRSNFFDDEQDLKSCLQFNMATTMFHLMDFDERQTEIYMNKNGAPNQKLPIWLPRRPLLIGYIVNQQLLADTSGVAPLGPDPSQGWLYLLDKICRREVNQVYIALHHDELLNIYSRISTKCRQKSSKLGPISFSDCKDAFFGVTQVEPEGRSLTALLRLPGLTGFVGEGGFRSDLTSGSRWFVDENFADALSGIDLAFAIQNPEREQTRRFNDIVHPVSELGVGVSVEILTHENAVGSILGAMERISNDSIKSALLIDLLQMANDISATLPRLIVASGQTITSLRLDNEDADMRNFSINGAYIEELFIALTDLEKIPTFSGCAIERIRTNLDASHISSYIDQTNEVEKIVPIYDNFLDMRAASNDERVQVLVNLIERIFVQSRTGRSLAALRRGNSPKQIGYVDAVIDILRRNEFIYSKNRSAKDVLFPTKYAFSDAMKILKDPETAGHPIVEQVKKL